MELRTASSPRDVKHYDTKRLREEFLIDDLFKADDVNISRRSTAPETTPKSVRPLI